MSRTDNQKIKLMKIYEILNVYSDETRPITTKELIARLKDEGVDCARKALYNDIDTLNKYGYEVETIRKKQNEYYIIDRSFDIPELKILIDAVQASNFITVKKSAELINKIARLAGTFRGEVLAKNVLYTNNTKKTNEKIYYSIDALDRAINEGKKVTFKYYDTNIDGEKVYRKDGKLYEINPVKLTISANQYYLICYDDKHSNLTNYRVDRMDEVSVTDIPKSFADCEKEENISRYTEGLFEMYGDKSSKVKIDLRVKNVPSMVDIVLDKFGKNIVITKKTEDYFYIRVDIHTSPTFYAWLTTFGGKIMITYPKKVKEEYKQFLSNNIDALIND